MTEYNNIVTFLNAYEKEPLKAEIVKLSVFTSCSKLERETIALYKFLDVIKKKNGCYIFKFNSKEYKFELFSDQNIQKCDKKILRDIDKRYTKNLSRVLKLLGSLDKLDTKIIVGTSDIDYINLLISYNENKEEKVIDYANNLVMNKKDYYEMTNFNEINIVTKSDLYKINCLIERVGDSNIFKYLIFTKEIFNELSNLEEFYFLTNGSYLDGINCNNAFLIFNGFDTLFFNDVDYNKPNKEVRNQIKDFTENPNVSKNNINYNKRKEKYIYKKILKKIEFGLLSDIVQKKETKEELLSNRRYRKCYINSIKVARFLEDEDKKSATIIFGKVKINEIDYTYHSWVEIENKNLVLDYNCNLIMNKDDYYKLYKVKILNKIFVYDNEKYIQTIVFDFGMVLHPLFINLFGEELYNDLKKNEKILKRKE